ATIAAHVKVPALLCRNDTDILALSLRTLASTSGDSQLDFVRRAQTAVPVLDLDRESDAVLDTVAAPCRADTGLHRAHCLTVCMTRLESGRYQIGPDEWQLMHLCAEQIYELAAGDLGIQAILAGYLAQHDELLGSNLTAGHARHDGIGPILLHVGQVI